MEKEVQIAKVTGIYTCLGIGETWYREVGQELPPCSCSGKRWELLKKNNLDRKNAITVLVRGDSLRCVIMDCIPEVGQTINLRSASHRVNFPEGEYRISFFDGNFSWIGGIYFIIEVERAGDLSDSSPIHEVWLT